MTTIAFDGKTLAFDSRVTDGGSVVGHTDKGIKTEHYIGAIAGDFSTIPRLRKWVEDGMPEVAIPKFKRGTEFILVTINVKNACITVYEDSFEPAKYLGKTFAFGSGAAHALGAMHAGASAKMAVQAAAAYDGYTGGQINTLEYK